MDTKPQGLDGEFARRVIKLMAAVNVRVYKLTRGRIGGDLAGRRRLAQARSRSACSSTVAVVPASCAPPRWSTSRTADRVVVVASQAGRTEPSAVVPQHRGRPGGHRADPGRAAARCAPAPPTPRSAPRCGRAWSTSTADYDSYQSWTDREIPVVVLEPRLSSAAAVRPDAVTIRQRGRRVHGLLTRRGRRTRLRPGNHTGGHQYLICDPGEAALSSTLEEPERSARRRPRGMLAGEEQIEGRSLSQIAWGRLRRDKVALAGGVFIIFLVLVAILAPLIVKITGGPPNEYHQDLLSPVIPNIPAGSLRRDELGAPDGPGDRQRPRHLQPGRLRRPHLAADRDPGHPASRSSSAPRSASSPASSAAGSTRSSAG